ncbi:chemotaxis protein CheB [Actinoplanes sp. N902-109]|uniref:chemotaxis protein CheB n=1 Tax=Actinoplanes sp. (strain N902-109) TaxID=649831 RepID=UPI0005A2E786|nr:chemotaxis protein CheB [Actinoplanes sp. N902-109]
MDGTAPRRDVVVIGGSAGSHDALLRIMADLPPDLAATVLVVVHLAAAPASALADMLARRCALAVRPAADAMTARPGHVYTAVPGRHLLIAEGDVLRLSRGPKQNRVRPAVDALFRSAARWCGPRVVGVLLSGNLDDGAAGLAAVNERGGAALVQDPGEARFPGMPGAARDAVPEVRCLPAAELAAAITELTGQLAGRAAGPPDHDLLWETEVLAEGSSPLAQPGQPVGLGCPECKGGMYRIPTGSTVHFVCHVGHSYSPQSLLAARAEDVGGALWMAVSALQEKAMVHRQLADSAVERGDRRMGRRYMDAADDASHAADLLRRELGSSLIVAES